MSDEKTKVKDVSADLGVSTKDLLGVLRELGINAKSPQSSLTTDEVDRVTERVKSGPAQREVMRKETASGVIVRRRQSAGRGDRGDRGRAPKPASSADGETGTAAPKAAKPDLQNETPRARVVRPAGAPAQEQVPTPTARIIKPAAAESQPGAADTPQQPTPGTGMPAGEEPQATAQPETATVAAPQAAPVQAETVAPKASAAPAVEAPAQEQTSAAHDDAEDDERKRKKKKPKKREEVSTPQVRIISLPTPESKPQPAAAERPSREQNRDGRDGRDGRDNRDTRRPSGGQAPRSGAPRDDRDRDRDPRAPRPPRPAGPAGSAGPAGPRGPRTDAAPVPAPGSEDARRRHAKGKRTVEFGRGDRNEDFGKKGTRGTKKGTKDQISASDEWQRGRKPKRGGKRKDAGSTQPIKAAKRKIRVDEAIRVADMAHQMGVKGSEVIKVLMQLGVFATINQSLDIDTATLVGAEFEYEVEKVGFSEEDLLLPHGKDVDTEENLKPRPPVVTIMGHVDHGKTSLLDAIRKSSITSGEAGGITQHIGAYHVSTKRGDLCFLDTPGHEAFTAMRARGAKVTDIVILVVAADDGVMEQTREAISHAKAAGVPIVVAVNKIDKEAANPDRVMRELAEQGLVPEDWGGDTIFAKVSAKTREGLDDLLELLALQAEVLELRANPDKPARGHIVEAKLDKGRGAVATVLVQEGTLKQGDVFVCGPFSGRVRAMFNDQGQKVLEAGPSTPAEVQGFDGVPEAGEEFVALEDEKVARRIAEQRAVKMRERTLARESKVTLETFLSRRADTKDAVVLNVVLKADVQGSVEAIVDALRKLATEQVKVEVIHSGAGSITESDILLASASDAVIIGFNVRPTVKVKEVADREGVDIRFYDIIYKLVEEIRAAMAGLLAPVIKEVYLGQAEVRETFSVPKVGIIAGCIVEDGKITRNAGIRLLRSGVVIYTGRASSLKRFKDDMKEVAKGYECGIGLENFNDIKIGDVIEAFDTVEEAATL